MAPCDPTPDVVRCNTACAHTSFLGRAEFVLLADLFLTHGMPGHIRSDQGPAVIAEAVKDWITGVGAKTAHIEKSSPWETGYVESFTGTLRPECLNEEVFADLAEARVVIERWQLDYNLNRRTLRSCWCFRRLDKQKPPGLEPWGLCNCQWMRGQDLNL